MNTLINSISLIANIFQALVLVICLAITFIGGFASIAIQTPTMFIAVSLCALTAAWILFVHNTWAYTID
jgi:hypothetical protein